MPAPAWTSSWPSWGRPSTSCCGTATPCFPGCPSSSAESTVRPRRAGRCGKNVTGVAGQARRSRRRSTSRCGLQPDTRTRLRRGRHLAVRPAAAGHRAPRPRAASSAASPSPISPRCPWATCWRRCRRLPPHSVVLYLTLFADGAGRAFIPHEALARDHRQRPTLPSTCRSISTWDGGGRRPRLQRRHARAARRASSGCGSSAASLRRAFPSSSPRPTDTSFDWRQLQRWGLDERRLPAGSVVQFRAPSVWDRYKWYIVGRRGPCSSLQSALIVGLLVSRSQRRRAQRTLAERLRFETLLSEVSAEFLTVPVERGRPSASSACSSASARRWTSTGRRWPSGRAARMPCASRTRGRAPGCRARPDAARRARPARGWGRGWSQATRSGSRRLDALPEEAAADRRSLAALGVRSLAAVPLIVDGHGGGSARVQPATRRAGVARRAHGSASAARGRLRERPGAPPSRRAPCGRARSVAGRPRRRRSVSATSWRTRCASRPWAS